MDEDEEPRVCADCVGDAFLKAQIERTGSVDPCSYCSGEGAPTISLEELADEVEGAFDRHFRRTSDQPSGWEHALLADRESTYEWERSGEPVVDMIAQATEIDEALAADIQEILEERHDDFELAKMGEEAEFSGDSHYASKTPDDVELRYEWRYFEHSLKTENRFFNRVGQALLARVFAGIGEHQTADAAPVIREAGPGNPVTVVYRARVFDNDADLEEALRHPDRELGPPPPRKARAGRMNAQGISTFYGALDPVVALAEVRPPVGSRVAVARFRLLHSVRLLDVEALRRLYVSGSIFDPDHLGRLELAKFLEKVSARMTRPVMPSDEPFDYLITQAIADYLATEIAPPLEGILFPSTQDGSENMNLVLFQASSKVAPLEQPDGIEFMVGLHEYTDEGEEPAYWVFEEVPPPPELVADKPTEFADFGRLDHSIFDVEEDAREPTLAIDLDEIEIHHIEGVQFTTTSRRVNRHRSIKRSAIGPGGVVEPF